MRFYGVAQMGRARSLTPSGARRPHGGQPFNCVRLVSDDGLPVDDRGRYARRAKLNQLLDVAWLLGNVSLLIRNAFTLQKIDHEGAVRARVGRVHNDLAQSEHLPFSSFPCSGVSSIYYTPWGIYKAGYHILLIVSIYREVIEGGELDRREAHRR